MLYRYLDPRVDDIDTVLSLRQKAMAMLAEGKTVMRWSGEGTSVDKAFPIPLDQLLEETKYFIRDYNKQYAVNSVKVVHM